MMQDALNLRIPPVPDLQLRAALPIMVMGSRQRRTALPYPTALHYPTALLQKVSMLASNRHGSLHIDSFISPLLSAGRR